MRAAAAAISIGSPCVPVISAARRQGRYDAILDAAGQAFAQKGFANVSVAQIAKAAGISDGLVYRYFRDKRDLLFHVLQAFYGRIMADLEAKVTREKGFAAQLETLIRHHLEVYVADTDLCRLFISEVRVAADYQGSPIQALNREYTSVLVKIVDDGIRAGEISRDVNSRLFRDALFGALEHRTWRYVNGRGGLDVAETARELTQLFTLGLSRRTEH
jgi:TetR/AcrR family fatty acid metabolism transcriptional regulator